MNERIYLHPVTLDLNVGVEEEALLKPFYEHAYGDRSYLGVAAIPNRYYKYLDPDGSYHWELVDEETLFESKHFNDLYGINLCYGHSTEDITPESYSRLVNDGVIIGCASPCEKQDHPQKGLLLINRFKNGDNNMGLMIFKETETPFLELNC